VNNPSAAPEPSYDLIEAPAPTFHVRKLFTLLRKFWWLPLLTLTLFVAAAAIYISRSAPTYVTHASMWETEKVRLPVGELFSDDPQNEVGNQTELIRSGKLRQLTLARLQKVLTNGLPLDHEGRPLQVELVVRQTPKTSIFTVEAIGADPEYIQVYLDNLINEYLAYKKDLRQTISGDTLASITDQVLSKERDLKADQDALTTFEQSNNLAILQEQGTVAGGYLEKLQTQLSDYKLQAQLLDATVLENGGNDVATTNFSAGLLDSAHEQGSDQSATVTGLQSAYQQVEMLKSARAKLSKYLRPKHPKIVKLDDEIEKSQELLDLYRTQNRKQLAALRQSLQMKSETVKASITDWEARVVDANARIAEADHLKLNVNRTQNLYDRLVTLLQSVDISRNLEKETLAVMETASPALRSYTHERSVLSLAAVGGFLTGLGIVLLMALRDDRLTSLFEVNATFGDSVVGLLPEMAQKDKSNVSLLEPDDERYMYAESYRNLRSALLYLPNEGERPKVLLITSAVPNEGKSTIAANLARTLAMGGSRVLLVDTDLRKGRLHDMMGLQREPGLAELLRQPDQWEAVIQKNSIQNFAFLSRGKALGHTSDLFLGQTFDQVLARMRREYDYVVLDSSPVFATDDAGTLAPKVDGTLFVVRGNFSGARQVREGLELLHHRQAKILGLVLNRADTSARSYHYYKYGGYNEPNGVPGASSQKQVK